jgi:hypothetical protein
MSAELNEMRVTTTPDRSVYLRFLFWVGRRQFRFLTPFAVLSIVCFLLVPFLPAQESGLPLRYRDAWPVLFLPGLLFVFVPLQIYAVGRKRWRELPEIWEPRTYVFNDRGFEVVGQSFRTQQDWSLLRIAYKHRDMVLLGTGQRQFFLVSLRDFESPELVDRFLTLVKSKVAKCKF